MLTELDSVDCGDVATEGLHHEASHLVPDISANRVKLDDLAIVELPYP